MVVSADGERSVLVEEEIDDRAEIGDFISYYTFDGSGDVTDRSGNGNDGTLEANGGNLPKRKGSGSGSYIEFSEADGSLDVGDLQTVGPAEVDEITIALRYEITGGQSTQELMQYRSGNFAWYMETRDRISRRATTKSSSTSAGRRRNPKASAPGQFPESRSTSSSERTTAPKWFSTTTGRKSVPNRSRATSAWDSCGSPGGRARRTST